MTPPDIQIRLVGDDEDNGAVRFDDFRIFCDKMSNCLRRAESVVTHRAGKIRYRVTRLNTGSAVLALEPVAPRRGPDQRTAVVGLFKKTVAGLQAGTLPDPRLTHDDLRSFRDLIASLRRTKEVWVDGEQLTSQYVANIDKILAGTVVSQGSVSGLLERLNVHNRNEFVLYPPIPGNQVICAFEDGLFEQVRAAIRRNVTVTGTLFHHPDKPFPNRVQVSTLDVHPPDQELPTLDSLRGLLRGCTQGTPVVEFVRALRDEHD